MAHRAARRPGKILRQLRPDRGNRPEQRDPQEGQVELARPEAAAAQQEGACQWRAAHRVQARPGQDP
jgi:hypothetical protein